MEIAKTNQELFVIQQGDSVLTDIKIIKEAFQQLEQQDRDLFHVFQTLVQEIVIHQEGTIDITYTFENPR